MQTLYHLADTHLDAPQLHLPDTIRPWIEQTEQQLLLHIAKTATEEQAVVLISGDFFDTPNPSTKTIQRVEQVFRGMETPIVILPGNHDPYFPGGVWAHLEQLSNVHVLKPDQTHVHIGDMHFYGQGYTHFNEQAPDIPMPEKAGVHILAWHGNVGTQETGFHVLQNKHQWQAFDYVALGHIHKTTEIFGLQYPGFSVGRSFDANGPGHWHRVTFHTGVAPKVERLPLPGSAFYTVKLPVDTPIDEAMDAWNLPRQSFVRVHVTGTKEEEQVLDVEGIAMALKQRGMHHVDVVDLTTPVIHWADEIEKPGFAGALATRLEAHKDDEKFARAVALIHRAQLGEPLHED